MSDADELIKKASGFFTKVGSTLKQTSKQVTGLGRGAIRVELDRTRVAPGDTLHGRVILSVPEAVDAKRLVVALCAHHHTAEIYRFELELAGAQAFANRDVAFELLVPFDALQKQAAAGSHPIADVVRTVSSALSQPPGQVTWSVNAQLDIPWGRNLAHALAIVIV